MTRAFATVALLATLATPLTAQTTRPAKDAGDTASNGRPVKELIADLTAPK